ncbi:hypothetical protein ACLKA7_007762 [Drosophila subpalustris]
MKGSSQSTSQLTNCPSSQLANRRRKLKSIKNNKKMPEEQNKEREEKLHSHVLSIENVDRHKGGVYICTANNGVGQPASSQVVLHVLYPPEISVERPVVFSGEGT